MSSPVLFFRQPILEQPTSANRKIKAQRKVFDRMRPPARLGVYQTSYATGMS
jgi:hypothetical protein